MALYQQSFSVFSTYVEVILIASTCQRLDLGFLHVCGGDPTPSLHIKVVQKFSPRMWRWSWSRILKVLRQRRFLHVCGGDPKGRFGYHNQYKFSPRMWRWSWIWDSTVRLFEVFSTYVEVILEWSTRSSQTWSFLHVCGGDPQCKAKTTKLDSFSPRMWRWSYTNLKLLEWPCVFSTYVEVIPDVLRLVFVIKVFSPRMWRWS